MAKKKNSEMVQIGRRFIRPEALESVGVCDQLNGDGESGIIGIGYSGAHYQEYFKGDPKAKNEDQKHESSKAMAEARAIEIAEAMDAVQTATAPE